MPGTVGSYPLKFTRYFNSRCTYQFNSTGGAWRFSYIDYAYKNGSCAGSVRVYGSVINPPTSCRWVKFPDGRVIDLTTGGPPPGVSEYVDDVTEAGQPVAYLRLPDGGNVKFEHPDSGGNYQVTQVIDPYGHATVITYNTDGTTKITEPGGRYLLITPFSKVEAFDGVSPNPIQWVHYQWTGSNLAEADYSDGTSAHYTYLTAGYRGQPICGVFPQQYLPQGMDMQATILATCDDVRFDGPMQQLAYVYQTTSRFPTTTQIKSENRLVNGQPGEIVSSVVGDTDYTTSVTETRGDGKTRVFNYHTACRPPDCPPPDTEPCPIDPQPLDGKLLNYTDFRGNTIYLTYADVGQPAPGYITSVKDANGHITTYTRSTQSWAILKITSPPTSTEPAGSTITQTFWPDEAHPFFLASRTTERYDANESGKPGSKVVYQRIASTSSVNPNAIIEKDYVGQDGTTLEKETFTYNNFGQVLKHGLRNGAYEYFQYDTRGLLFAKTNPTWTNVTYDVNNLGNFPSGEAKTSYSYYSSTDTPVWADRIKTETDPRGFQTIYEYDRALNGNGENSGAPSGSPVAGRGLVTKISYPNDTHDGTITGGTAKIFAFDKYGNKLWEKNELGQQTSYQYDGFNRLTQTTDPVGNIWTNNYLPWGQTSSYVTTSKLPFVTTVPAGQTTNKTTNFYYDNDWHRIQTKEAPGVSGQEANTYFGYDAVGNQTYVTEPRGSGANDPNYTTSTTYDERNRKLTVTDPQGHITRFAYDRCGNVISTTKPDGVIETNDCDEFNRVTHTRTPKEGTAGAPSAYIDNYFNYYRLPTDTQMIGALKNFIDGENKTTNFKYHPAGVQTRRIYPDNADPNNPTDYMEWTYDNSLNPVSRRTVAGITQNFTYDERNRKRSMTWSNGLDYANFKYDAAGRLTNADNANATILRGYTSAGELQFDKQTITGLGLKDVEYVYTKTKPTQMYVVGASYDYTLGYDATGRFETIKPTGGSVAFQYKYDAASNETERDNLLNGVNQFYSRDNLGRMSERDVKLGTSMISGEIYGYDAMSRLTSTARENGLGDSFTYWLDGEVQNATYEQPTPTPTATPTPTPPNQCQPVTYSTTGGGRTTLKVYLATATSGATIFYTASLADYVTPTHNGLTPLGSTVKYTGTPINVLVGQEKYIMAVAYKSGMTDSTFTQYDAYNAGGGMRASVMFNPLPHAASYNFDKAGNRTSVVDTGVTTNYTRNNLNQYTGVGPDAVTNGSFHELSTYQGNSYSYVNDERLAQVTSSSPVHNYQLKYDALGRCVKRTLDNVTTYYVYDGEKPILEYNASGVLTAKNLYGKGIDEVLQRTDIAASKTLYYQNDHEGSITQITDSNGAPIETYRYDVFGAPAIEDINGTSYTYSPLNNRFLFTGREYQSTFGIYEYRARAYHPWIGRFMSEDPKGYEAGDYNLFRYVMNDPTDRVDPMGLEDIEISREMDRLGAAASLNSLHAAEATFKQTGLWKGQSQLIQHTVDEQGRATGKPELQNRINEGGIKTETRREQNGQPARTGAATRSIMEEPGAPDPGYKEDSRGHVHLDKVKQGTKDWSTRDLEDARGNPSKHVKGEPIYKVDQSDPTRVWRLTPQKNPADPPTTKLVDPELYKPR